jgi:Flp pilus assembly protein TadG
MHNLLRCRRGTAAFATVVALVPLIGVVALGSEAGSWYATKQHAQNAADAGAYSGGLQLACQIAGQGATCATQSVAYRGKEFAAQNGFCNAKDTTYPGSQCAASLPSGTSQTVQINQLTSWNGVNGNFVQAVVQQTQPAYLAHILGLSTVNIGAQAVAQVKQLMTPACTLALTGSISFEGSPNINTSGCSMASNDTAQNALNFTGGGMTINLCPPSGSNCGSLSAAGGCTGSSTFCGASYVHTYTPPVTNPFSALDSTTMPTLSNCKGSGLTPYSAATPCTNNNVKLSGNGNTPVNGVYFISGTLTLTGTVSIQGTALFILLPGASIDTKGGGTINITGIPDVTSSQVPAAFQPYAEPSCQTTSPPSCLFNNMAIYDQSNVPVSIGGTSNINFDGSMYLPNEAVTLQGNPTLDNSNCEELIAGSIAFNGNPTFNVSGCSKYTPQPISQAVWLMQ